MMNHNLLKIEDVKGLNYIVQSKLTHFERKTIADKFSIKSVKKGIEHYVINGQQYRVGNHNFIIVSPGQEVQVNIDSSSAVEGTCYFMEPNLVNQIRYANHHSIEANLDHIEPLVDDVTFDNIPVNAYYTLLEKHLKTIALSDFDQHYVSDYLIAMAELMVKHQNQTKARLTEIKSIKTGTKKELYKRIQAGRQFIHDNFQKPITLNEMSKAATLSEYYFHRVFRNFFKITPCQYHNLVRMEKAQSLLNKGKHSKTEVAYICGFQDPKYFSKAYKKWQQI